MEKKQDGNEKKVHYVGDSRVRSDRKKLKPKDYSEFPGKTDPFFPNYLLKEWMVAAVFLVGFMALVLTQAPPLGDLADPTNTDFLPVPDWYFLFLYQLLKFEWAAGKFVVIGTLVIPGIVFTALILAPWLDRSPERRPTRRPIASGLMILALIAVVTLTWAAQDEYKKTLAERGGGQQGGGEDVELVAEDDPGYEIYKANQSCLGCHGEQLQGGASGPSLLGVGGRLSAEEIENVINNGRGAMPGGMFQGTDEEKQQLIDWLAKQK